MYCLYHRLKRHLSWGCHLSVASVVLLCLSSCSVGTLFREELVKEKATVLLSDKTVHTGRTLLPDYKGRGFRFVTEEGKRMRLHSSDVTQLRFSRNGALTGTFIYVPYTDRSGQQRKAAWMNCYGLGENLKIALLSESWHYDRKGELKAVSFSEGEVYIIGIKDGEPGQYVSCLGHSRNMMIRAFCKFLADDPKLCEQLTSKEVDVYDFAEICQRYAPKDLPAGNYQVFLPTERDMTKGGWL